MADFKKSFLDPLKKLSQLFTKTKTKGVVVGGISAGILGKPRFTADIDAVILLDFDQIEGFIKKTAEFGFVPRIKDVVDFAMKSHVILLVHKKSGINIDLSIGMLPFEIEMIQRSIKFKAEKTVFNIPSPEDLIVLKAIAHRPKDIEDIRSIIVCQKNLDVKRIKRCIKEFSSVLEMPELYNDIKKLLSGK